MKNPPILVKPGGKQLAYWADIWAYRDLLFQLIRKDVILRFRQTSAGVAWLLLRPLMFMAVLVLVFGYLARFPSGGISYPVFVLSAFLPWQFASSAMVSVASSVVQNATLVNKVYFPRLIIPLSSLGVPLFEFGISLLVLIGLMLWQGYWPSWSILFLPFLMFWLMALSVGIGLWFASLSVMRRDFLHVLPYFVQISLYLSPVGYSSEMVPESWKMFYALNPLVGPLESFRWMVLGNRVEVYWEGIFLSLGVVILLFVTGLWSFRKRESTFADVI